MRSLPLVALALALAAGSAFAQQSPPAPAQGVTPPAAPQADAAPPAPPRMPGPGPQANGGPGAPLPDGPGGHKPPPPPPNRAAHFRLERGDTSLDVRCAEDEPMKTCADLALQMLDKMQTLPATKAQ